MKTSSIILLLVAMVSIQLGAALAKQLFSSVGPTGVTLLRTFLAAVILVSIWRPWRKSWSPLQLKNLALYGISLGAMNLLFYLSLQHIPLGIAVGLEFTGPLAVAIFSSRKWTDFVWALFAALGIFLILPLSEFSSDLNLHGVLFALGAGFFWALYILFGKKAGEGTEGGHSAAIGMVFAALVALPFGVAEAGTQLLHWEILPLGLAVAVLSSAIPYSLEMISLKSLPTKTFGILMSLEPVLATLVGVIFLKELLTTTQLAAIACIVVASLGSAVSARKTLTPPVAP